VTVERPLRLRVDLDPKSLSAFRAACVDEDEEPLANVVERVAASLGPGPHLSFNTFMEAVEADANEHGVKLTAARKKLLKDRLAKRDEKAAEIIGKTYKPGKVKPDPLRGLFEATVDGKPCVVEYEPDTELRDTEQIPLLEEGGIAAFIRREVLPHVPDAWYVPESVKTGYEISFTRYFYKPQPLRSLEAIRADILALEKETEGLLGEIIGGSGR
jgi:type I restriction enzyme M protein